jgi:hypothetical protein
MKRLRAGLPTAFALSALASLFTGCATTQYTPQAVARGELTLRYDGQFSTIAGGQQVARGLTYSGLEDYVRCVPAAREHARDAAENGRKAIAFSVLGAALGAGGLIGFGGLANQQNWVPWIAGGLGSASLGLVFSILSWRAKNHANGHALDAVNYYNDSVGSLGASCQDLSYPPPVGPAEAAPLPVPSALPGALPAPPSP